MFDIHSHVLPAVDDGAKTLSDSLNMARLALAGGASTMVMTPHRKDILEEMEARAVNRMVVELQRLLDSEGVALKLVAGMENHLEADLAERAKDGSALTINGGRYILVELDFHEMPMYAESVLRQMQLQGLAPIIAHPERQMNIARDPGILHRMVENGVLAQVTAGSLLGAFGPQTKRVAESLVERRLVQIIASDAHRPAGPRSPGLVGGVERAARLVGEDEARAMALDTPRAVVEDKPVFHLSRLGKGTAGSLPRDEGRGWGSRRDGPSDGPYASTAARLA